MGNNRRGTITVIKEGKVRKGGVNEKPSTPRPSTWVQGFGEPSSIKGKASLSSVQKDQPDPSKDSPKG